MAKVMRHWHWSRPSNRPVNHTHKGGDKVHAHLDKKWISYGRTKKSLVGKARYL